MFDTEDIFFLKNYRKWLKEEEERYVDRLVGSLLEHSEYSRVVGYLQAIRAAKDQFEDLVKKSYPN